MTASAAQRWLEMAREDQSAAALVAEQGFFRHACFLAQQAIEKALKAYLVHRTGSHPRTHRLVDLLNECARLQGGFAEFRRDCIVIEQYYTAARYPNGVPEGLSEGLFEHADAQGATDAAARILEFVQGLIEPA